ncbi:MAG: methionyl-tRNA formyltransferase [Gammaproteobacteria bacterium]|nr:methionyl-tRNA formyltransferase [Gammaproteobacteria bacterium]
MSAPLRIVFVGTSEFAVPVLEHLIASPHTICAVYTQPDRPAGRGQKLAQSPIKQLALQHELPLYQPETLKNEEALQTIQQLSADIMVDAAYGLLLPKEILGVFKYGCINVHPSLLPRWRGAAPVQRTILAGDIETGVTIMQVDEGWDTGDILKQSSITIAATDTTTLLQAKLAAIGTKLLLEVLQEIATSNTNPTPQDDTQSSYAKKITKAEAAIDWNLTALELDQMVRAFNPWPIAFANIDQLIVRIWRATPLSDSTNSAPPGTIINADKNGIDVATGAGILRLLELQLPGGKILPTVAILNSKQELFKPGKRFNA